jgi:hypothetical protein
MFVNLTPHAIHLHGAGGITTVPADGRVARCATIATPAGAAFDGTPLMRRSFGAVTMSDGTSFPDPQEGTMFIVSALVGAALPGRDDVASPGNLVRDPDGNIIGCTDLTLAPA